MVNCHDVSLFNYIYYIMKFTFVLIIVLLISHFKALSQKKPYFFIYENLDSLVSVNGYEHTKQLIQSYDKKFTVYPDEVLRFLDYSLDNEDVIYYKTCIKSFSKKYGYILSKNDTIDLKYMGDGTFVKKIEKNGLIDWTMETTQKNYKKWISNNPDVININRKLYALEQKDQYLRIITASFMHLDSAYYAKELENGDYDNLLSLLQIYKENDSIIPNSFDNGVKHPQAWLVIWHNIKNPNQFNTTWALLMPYIEKTYFAGKIGVYYFQVIDYWMNEFYGEQYYGTLKNVPIRDIEHFEERKKKYKL